MLCLFARFTYGGLVHTTSVRRRISLTLHGAPAKCIVGPSVHLAPWPPSKVEASKCSTFQAAPDPSANQIAVMENPRLLDPFRNNKQEEAGNRYIFLKKCGMIGLFLVTCCLCHLLYLYPEIGFVAGSDLFGCSMRLQRLVPYTSDTPSVIRRRTHAV